MDSEQPFAAAPVTFRGTGGGVDVRLGHPQQLLLSSVRVAVRRPGNSHFSFRGISGPVP